MKRKLWVKEKLASKITTNLFDLFRRLSASTSANFIHIVRHTVPISLFSKPFSARAAEVENRCRRGNCWQSAAGRKTVNGQITEVAPVVKEVAVRGGAGDTDDHDVVGNRKSYRIIRGYRGGQIVTVRGRARRIVCRGGLRWYGLGASEVILYTVVVVVVVVVYGVVTALAGTS